MGSVFEGRPWFCLSWGSWRSGKPPLHDSFPRTPLSLDRDREAAIDDSESGSWLCVSVQITQPL